MVKLAGRAGLDLHGGRDCTARGGRPAPMPSWFSPVTSPAPAPVTARAEAHRRADGGVIAPATARRWASASRRRPSNGPAMGLGRAPRRTRAVTITRYGPEPLSAH